MGRINIEALQEIQMLLEILRELDDIDTLGHGLSIQAKILSRIEQLVDVL
jgi:hypothetical protein